MMARYTDADVIVVGLIGERGREIKEFLEDILGESDRSRSVIVAAPSDMPPITRMQGAHYATAIAEYFRDQNLNVLLLMDSLTRYAMAARGNCPVHRRIAGHQGLSTLGVCKTAGPAGAHRHGCTGSGFDHRLLYRPGRRR